jgi:LacI family transcriptional regulator
MKQPKANVTLGDVASDAGVSVSTVARVLNARVDVAPETAAVVRRLVEELGYAPGTAARSRTSGMVGHIVPDPWHPFTALVLRSVNQVIAQSYNQLAYASDRRNTHAQFHESVADPHRSADQGEGRTGG